jgi:hypothetical protein
MRKAFVLLISLGITLYSGLLAGQGSQTAQDQGKRLAIVIGNANYLHSPELSNPVNDARAMRDALQGVGFDVFEYENLTQPQMKKAIDDFGTRLKNYTIGLFFYAGHGIQSKGVNFLIPVDANIESEQQIEYDCVQADRVLGFMEAAGSKVNIVVLDACRNNPFERGWSRSMDGSGLAFMNAPSGSLIAYATSPGRTASDGSGSNGLYTSALLEHLKTPDITILQMFQNVRRTVSEKSYKQQIPWESTSLTADFYFVNPSVVVERSDMKASWMLSGDGYYFYINNENVSTRIVSAWSDEDLLVYDPVTNMTCLLENYNGKSKDKMMEAKILGSSTNSYWKSDKGYYYLYVKGEQIAARTKSVYVDKDLLAYDGQTNTTYILKGFGDARDKVLTPSVVFDNADFAFWRKQNNSFWLYVKGEDIQNRTQSGYVGNDLIVYDTKTNITYLFKDYLIDTEELKLRPASVVSYQDNVFWLKRNNTYWLIVKGQEIQHHVTSKWSGDDLYVTDTNTNITYILPDYANASENQLRVALVNP